MQIHLLVGSVEAEMRALLADEHLAASIRSVQVHRDIDELLAAVEVDRWAIAILDDLGAISALRAARDAVAVIAVGKTADEAELLRGGADDFVSRSRLSVALVARAMRHARERNELHREEIDLVRSVREFGESLVGDGRLDAIVDRVLSRVVGRSGASIGYLVCEWKWKGQLDRVDALAGAVLAPDAVRALATHPRFSPLIVEPGRYSLEPDDLADLAGALGPVRSLMVVPVARTASWGRGGIVLASSRVNAFGPRHARVATGLAAWAGVAIMQAGIIRERNRAVEVRERILAMASHDLRTPLSVFNMALELLSDCEDPEERAEVIGRAERASASMKRLIDDLLDYAAVDAGTLRIERSPTNPLRVARRALEQVAMAAEKKSITTAITDADERTWRRIEVDGGRIAQLLVNLLDNAVKFTPVGGRVEMCVSQDAEATIISVADTGPGIDEATQRQLFERYYSSASPGKGFGLGLAIARGIAESHDGALVVESSPGQGARFILTLPDAPRD